MWQMLSVFLCSYLYFFCQKYLWQTFMKCSSRIGVSEYTSKKEMIPLPCRRCPQYKLCVWKVLCLSAVSAAHLADLETTCHLHLLSSPWQSGANDLEGYTVPLHMGLSACVSLCIRAYISVRLKMQFWYLDEFTPLLRLFGVCICVCVCLSLCMCIVRLCWYLCIFVQIAAWDLFSSAWRVPVHLGLWSSLLAE